MSTPLQTPTTPLQVRDATFAIVDVETTGIDPRIDRVVEVACMTVRADVCLRTFASLVDPGRHIPATASAVHHLTDRHVASAPRLADLRSTLLELCGDAIVVAHNAAFDLAFLPFLAHRPVLCTMRLARRVIADAPNYKNQVLRYHLGIDDIPENTGAHRASHDVLVTSRILRICLERYLASGYLDDAYALVRYVAEPARLTTLPFGRHRGRPLDRVPDDYLRWILDAAEAASTDVRLTAAFELERRVAAP